MDPWKILKEKTVFEAAPYVRVVQQAVALPDGRTVDDFYQVHLNSFALIVPVLKDGRILVIRSYRHGAGKVVLSFPAGFVDEGEQPDAAARRELMEETGHRSGALVSLGSYVDNGNQRGSEGHFFLSKDCEWERAPDAGDLEEMSVETRTVEELDAALDRGDFGIVHSAAAWAFARRHLI